VDGPAAPEVRALAPREPAAREPVARPRRWKAATALAAGVLLGGFVAWVILGALGTTRTAPPEERVIELGGVSLTVPSDWLPARSPSSVVADLGAPTAVLDPYPGMRIHAIVVNAPRGVPPALSAMVGALGTGRTTELAGRPARAYAGRPIRGDRVAELTVARSSAGALIVACVGPTSSWDVAAGCADAVGPAPGRDGRS
jgi:hypothetical protein